MTTEHFAQIVAAAYQAHPIGSRRFCKRIGDASGLAVSDREVARIASRATTAEAFMALFNNDDFWNNDVSWQDCHNDCEAA
jgi:hypothetical protein